MESTHTHGTGFLGRATAALLPAESLSKWLSAAGMSVFMLMVFLTFVDVFLRYCSASRSTAPWKSRNS